jgi:hypothetical protein
MLCCVIGTPGHDGFSIRTNTFHEQEPPRTVGTVAYSTRGGYALGSVLLRVWEFFRAPSLYQFILINEDTPYKTLAYSPVARGTLIAYQNPRVRCPMSHYDILYD